jgi:uncharacterized protein YijF (DUF1287 family)
MTQAGARTIGEKVVPAAKRTFVALGIVALGVAGSAEVLSEPDAERMVEGARLSVSKKPRYDGSYVRLPFPGGDPGWERGVCADLVIRAFRHAGIDLQERVHRDILARPEAYGLRRADASIDHRRVRHLKTFFERHAARATEWRPGDIVIWDLKGGTFPNHIGIVSDRRSRDGTPLVIHHMNRIGPFTGFPGEDDSLHRWRILAHFRWTGDRP